MEFPTPNVIEILAEVADATDDRLVAGHPSVIQSLSQVAGATERAIEHRLAGRLVTVTSADERRALVRLAAHCIARIDTLNGKGAKFD